MTPTQQTRLRAKVLLLLARTEDKKELRFTWQVLRTWLEWPAASPSNFAPIADILNGCGELLVAFDAKGVCVQRVGDKATAKPAGRRKQAAPRKYNQQAQEVFEYYKQAMKRPRIKADRSRMRRIISRLREGFSVQDCCAAVDGILKSDFHCGANKTGQTYLEISNVFKDAETLERFRRLASGEKEAVAKDKIQSNNEALSGADKYRQMLQRQRKKTNAQRGGC